ncbi:protein TolQ [Porphyrobacter sp. ULC335]|uniref:protein TolQ n=1 Tax=Porphyrobacter sp. ULC335 TaxID=2854260 RepID=UPI00221F7A09|nr:protein TolQ [Porphyrobacter sp. ULC335]UYV17041.1 protein TolQ [Porphyrobacter sp. ULC335]
MTLALLSAAAAPTRLDPVELFLQADIIVQAVMIGLILASVWVWMIIVSFSMRIGALGKKSREYEGEFWEQRDREALLTKQVRKEVPAARVAAAGLDEWRKSTAKQPVDRDATRQRIAAVMESQIAEEADELAGRLNFLATVGSVAPFVGLFGTVWGIMNSFFQIGAQQSASLAVVAPGIAEALFATAIGLFAAIPAVIAYNRFGGAVDRYEAGLQRFADRLHTGLSRELDRA